LALAFKFSIDFSFIQLYCEKFVIKQETTTWNLFLKSSQQAICGHSMLVVQHKMVLHLFTEITKLTTTFSPFTQVHSVH